MYKYLIIGVALMFFSSGAYYLQGAGGNAITDAIAGKDVTQENFIPVNKESLPGTYICNTVSTCKNKYTLILNDDQSLEMTSDSSAFVKELGTWDLGIQNMLILNITNKGDITYDKPQKIVIKNVKTTTLSKISYTKDNYKDMRNPIFIRQD